VAVLSALCCHEGGKLIDPHLGLQDCPMDTFNIHPLVPVHSLSDDILYAIFMLVFDTDSVGTETQYLQVPPWNLSAVCQRWRSITINSPSLWIDSTTAPHHLVCPSSTKQNRVCTNALDIRRNYLQIARSGSLLLKVDFLHKPLCHLSRSALQAMLFNTHRWGTLYLSQATVLDNIFTLLPPDFSFRQLHTLFYNCEAYPGFPLPIPNPTTNFCHLRHLELSFWDPEIIPCDLPWLNLHTLYLEYYYGTMDLLLGLLDMCRALTRFYLEVSIEPSTQSEGIPIPTGLVSLPCLEQMELFINPDDYSTLLGQLCMPHLRMLVINTVDGISHRDVTALAQVTETSECTISSLELAYVIKTKGVGDSVSSESNLLPFFESLRGLEFLSPH
jgi:hypothetical protein